MSRPRTDTFIIGLVLILALSLRLYDLNAGLWYDEILMLTQSVRLSPEELLTTFGSLNNHILYTWLAKLSTGLFGESAWALRLPAAVLGVGSIWATWLLLKDMGWRIAALLVALLLALSYHHVWFSQNARGYTGLMFFGTMAAWSLLWAVRTNRMVWWVCYGSLSGLAMLVHLSAIFLTAGQAAALAVSIILSKAQSRETLVRTLAGPALAAAICATMTIVVFAPLAPAVMSSLNEVAAPAFASGEEGASRDITEWRNPLWTVLEIMSSFDELGIVLLPMLGLAAWGGYHFVRRAPVVAGGFLLALPITLAVLLGAGMRIWPRYFFPEIGVLLACGVLGAFALAEFVAANLPAKLRNVITADRLKIAGSAIIVLAFLPLLTGNYSSPKQNFAGAIALVRDQAQPFDQVVTVGLSKVALTDYLTPDWPNIATESELTARTQNGTVWVVTAFPSHVRTHFPEIASRLEQSFTKVREFGGTLAGGEVTVWRSDAGQTASSSR